MNKEQLTQEIKLLARKPTNAYTYKISIGDHMCEWSYDLPIEDGAHWSIRDIVNRIGAAFGVDIGEGRKRE
jgi:hypothetical protein